MPVLWFPGVRKQFQPPRRALQVPLQFTYTSLEGGDAPRVFGISIVPSSLLLSLHLLPFPRDKVLAEGVPGFDAFLLYARALVLQLFYFAEGRVALAGNHLKS